jgi:hypothetical protein
LGTWDISLYHYLSTRLFSRNFYNQLKMTDWRGGVSLYITIQVHSCFQEILIINWKWPIGDVGYLRISLYKYTLVFKKFLWSIENDRLGTWGISVYHYLSTLLFSRNSCYLRHILAHLITSAFFLMTSAFFPNFQGNTVL